MKRLYFFYFLFTLLIISSCSSSKKVLYMQDIDKGENYVYSYAEYKLKPDDILKIDISSENPESISAFTTGVNSSSMNYSRESMILNGYKINNEGDIYFPSIGKLKVVGKSITEVRNIIFKYLTEGGFLLNPIVDVKLINASFTVLGEVNFAGKHNFIQNNLNILEAIGIAGDLTINGLREDIKLIRELDGKTYSYSYDLTTADILHHENFQIYPGDVIIVKPNSSRVKNAGLIGNSGTLLSLLSFILSSIIVISN